MAFNFGLPGLGTTGPSLGNLLPKAGGGGMGIGTILGIIAGVNLLLGLLQPSQESLMETQGDIAVKTQKELMAERLRMAQSTGIQPPYQSPFLGEMDPMVLKALMANLGRTSNWGWPEGQGMNTDFITQALSNMGNIPPLSTGSPRGYPDRPGAVRARGWIPPELNIGG